MSGERKALHLASLCSPQYAESYMGSILAMALNDRLRSLCCGYYIVVHIKKKLAVNCEEIWSC